MNVILEDLSEGVEKLPIRVVNEFSDETPRSFTYINEMFLTRFHDHPASKGCTCIGGCSDSHPCVCVRKNDKREIRYNEGGLLVESSKEMIYECGPNCKCPPSCENRVSQYGIGKPLELFKTPSKGWGVRCREDVQKGTFICEYLGELIKDKEADQRDETYLLDVDGGKFTIDPTKYGNVSRFINHSCSGNLVAENVLYDHNDKKAPHIMFFAGEDIPALEELTWNYNYKMNSIRDANGNIKVKYCRCGSTLCTGRLY